MAIAVTVVLAEFASPLARGSDGSGQPPGAAGWLTGSGLDATEDGDASRVRTRRFWMGVWPDASAAMDFAAAPAGSISLLGEAASVWSAALAPYRTHGTLNWVPDGAAASVYPALADPPARDDPVAVITTVGMTGVPEQDRRFHAANRRGALSCAAAEGCERVFQGIPDNAAADGPNLSVWRDQGAFIAWAYRSDPHRGLMALREDGTLARGSFTRLRFLAQSGA